MSNLSPLDGIDVLLTQLLSPFVADKERAPPHPRFPEKALRALDGIQDFSARGLDVLELGSMDRHRSFLYSLIRETDRLEKKGRTLFFELDESRPLLLPGLPFKLTFQKRFSMEFRSGNERFSEPEVAKRVDGFMENLARTGIDAPPESILISGILPQVKKLLGIHTPIGVEGLGLRFSLRFLLAAFGTHAVRVFIAGPVLKEIHF
jgi:hypothetical protein